MPIIPNRNAQIIPDIQDPASLEQDRINTAPVSDVQNLEDRFNQTSTTESIGRMGATAIRNVGDYLSGQAKMSADEVNQRFGPVGPDGIQQKITQEPQYTDVAMLMGKYKADQIDTEGRLQRWQYQNPNNGVKNFVRDSAAFMFDPLNMSTMFIPGIGEATTLKTLGEVGVPAFAAKTIARATTGALTATVAQSPLTAIKYAEGQNWDSDYDARAAFYDMKNAAVMGAIFHAGFGAVGDYWKGRTNVGKAKINLDLVPTLEDQKIPLPPEADAVLNSDAITKDNAMRSAASQVVDGRPVDVDSLFPKSQTFYNIMSPEGDIVRPWDKILDFEHYESPNLSEQENIAREQDLSGRLKDAASQSATADEIARTQNPELFGQLDSANKQYNDALSEFLSKAKENTETQNTPYNDAVSQINDQISSILGKVNNVESRLTNRKKSTLEFLRNSLAEIKAEQSNFVAPHTDEMASLKTKIAEAEQRRRDITTQSNKLRADAESKLRPNKSPIDISQEQLALRREGWSPDMTQGRLAEAAKEFNEPVPPPEEVKAKLPPTHVDGNVVEQTKPTIENGADENGVQLDKNTSDYVAQKVAEIKNPEPENGGIAGAINGAINKAQEAIGLKAKEAPAEMIHPDDEKINNLASRVDKTKLTPEERQILDETDKAHQEKLDLYNKAVKALADCMGSV